MTIVPQANTDKPTALQEQMGRLADTALIGGERTDAVDHCLAGIARLSKEVKDASSYLPAYDQRTYSEVGAFFRRAPYPFPVRISNGLTDPTPSGNQSPVREAERDPRHIRPQGQVYVQNRAQERIRHLPDGCSRNSLGPTSSHSRLPLRPFVGRFVTGPDTEPCPQSITRSERQRRGDQWPEQRRGAQVPETRDGGDPQTLLFHLQLGRDQWASVGAYHTAFVRLARHVARLPHLAQTLRRRLVRAHGQRPTPGRSDAEEHQRELVDLRPGEWTRASDGSGE